MNNVFRLALAGCFAITTCTLQAQTENTQPTGADSLYAHENHFDKFNSFYLHPMRSHFEGRMLQAEGGLTYSSNCGVNSLAYAFYLQNPIGKTAIQNTISKLSEINTGGRDNTAGLKYIFPVKNHYNNFFYVSYNYRRHQSVKFTSDFGKFFFQGNKQFAGKEIVGDDLRYITTRYDALQVGWIKYFAIKGKAANISVGAGLARGFNYWKINAPKLRIFTEENGDYVQVDADFNAQRSGSINKEFWKANGYGALADIKFNLLLSNKSGIGVEVNDFGFISWNDRSAVYNKGDTGVRFDGVFIPSLDSLQSDNYVNKLGDSIVNRFNVPYTRSGFTSMIPTRISLVYYMGFTPKNYLNIKLQVMAFTTYNPQLSIESVNFIKSRFYSTTGIAIGGFGPLDIYQGIGWQFKQRYFAGLNLYGLEGILFPNKMAGFGGSLSLSVRL